MSSNRRGEDDPATYPTRPEGLRLPRPGPNPWATWTPREPYSDTTPPETPQPAPDPPPTSPDDSTPGTVGDGRDHRLVD